MVERATLTDPITPRNVQPVGMSGLGDPVFSDEFQRASWDNGKWEPWYPDTPFWATTQPGGHKTNSFEPQGYDETGLEMRPEGAIRFNFHASNHAVPELAYTSGMLTSYPSFSATYGVFEARMKLTNTQGAWPAFWMLRQDQVWPQEIDIMENWGRPSWNTAIVNTFHFPRPTPSGYSSTTYGLSADAGNAFHTYSCRWEPGRIRWYVDGVLSKDLTTEYAPAVPMYMILNLAGDKDDPNAASHAPFSIDIDYVRAWALGGAYVDPPVGTVTPPLDPANPVIPPPDPEDPEDPPVDPEDPEDPITTGDFTIRDSSGNRYTPLGFVDGILTTLTPRRKV